MASSSVITAACLVAAVTVTLLVTGTLSETASPVVTCYVGSWAVHRPKLGKFSMGDIDPNLCTHVIYAFAGINGTTNQIMPLEPSIDLSNDLTNGSYAEVVALKKINSLLKVSIAVGGWLEGSKKFSHMASTNETRKIFIDSVINFIKEHNFDGIDMDWEYPTTRGGKAYDRENFVQLCKELRTAFNPAGWLLTAVFTPKLNIISTAYDLPALSKELDYIHLVAYDYHGKWDGRTGHHTALYASGDETESQKVLNVKYTVDYYLKNDVPPSKLVLGLALYGRTFVLKDPNNTDIGAPASSTAFRGPYTNEDGYLATYEICEVRAEDPDSWNVVFHEGHQAPYMYKDNKWVSFDNAKSLGLKVDFAQSRNLAGVMVWSVDNGDFRGTCGNGKYPLLVAINKALGRNVTDSSDAAPVTSSQSVGLYVLLALFVVAIIVVISIFVGIKIRSSKK